MGWRIYDQGRLDVVLTPAKAGGTRRGGSLLRFAPQSKIAATQLTLRHPANGIEIIDVSDAFKPRIVAELSSALRDNAFDAEIVGDYLFVAVGVCGVRAFDISDPTAPVLAGCYDTPGSAHALDVYGDHVFVADRSGMLILSMEIDTAAQ